VGSSGPAWASGEQALKSPHRVAGAWERLQGARLALLVVMAAVRQIGRLWGRVGRLSVRDAPIGLSGEQLR